MDKRDEGGLRLVGYMGVSTHVVFDSPSRNAPDRFVPVYEITDESSGEDK